MSRVRASEPVISRAFLQSMHPTGAARQIRQLDLSNESTVIDRQADVVILAPRWEQIRNRKRRRAAVAQALSALAAGGIIYVFASGPWRLLLAASLRKRGLLVGRSFIHMNRGTARCYVPLGANSLRFALTSWSRSRKWWQLLRLLESIPRSAAVLAAVLPDVGFMAHRDKSVPFAWLLSHLPEQDACEPIVATSWRGPDAPTLIFAIDPHRPKPALVAKWIPPACCAAARHEAAMLAQLGPRVGQAGMRVPQVVAFTESADFALLLQTAVPGRPMSQWIAEGRRDFGGIVDQLAAWLAQWHVDTVEHIELTRALCEQAILSPARVALDALDSGAVYLDWLSTESERLIGQPVPLVATHNDLTMTNILGDADRCLGVVDWEAALPHGLPLADFWYAVCDAATAVAGGNRLSAFRQCFVDNGPNRLRIAASQDRLRSAVGGPAGWIDLCFHACWLQHAANEEARATSAKDRSFLGIVDVLARSVIGKRQAGQRD